MKFCVDYNGDFKYLDKVDEITIKFKKKNYTIKTILDFMLEHKNQRINISIEDPEYFLKHHQIVSFNAIKKEYPDLKFVFRLGDYKDDYVKEIYKMAADAGYPLFFSTQIKDWDTFIGYLNLNPTDIYLVEDMGFQLDKAADLAHKLGVSIRVFPNVAQSSWDGTPALKKFFIRPDDIEYYEPYVDVMEFYGRPDSISTYYKIYAIDHKWLGKLNEIILSFDSEIDNRGILPSFAERRIKCNKKCIKGSGCQVCEALEHLSDTLMEHDLTIKDFER